MPSRWSSSCCSARAEQPRSRDLDLLPAAVLGDDPDLLAAGDVGDVARDREAALEVAVVALGADDPRVDQLVELALDLDDAGLQRFAELRRREADARRVAHRVGEVVEQLVQVLAEAVDRLALEAQPGVAEQDDGADTHGGEVYRRGRTGRPLRSAWFSARSAAGRRLVAGAIAGLAVGRVRLGIGGRRRRAAVGQLRAKVRGEPARAGRERGARVGRGLAGSSGERRCLVGDVGGDVGGLRGVGLDGRAGALDEVVDRVAQRLEDRGGGGRRAGGSALGVARGIAGAAVAGIRTGVVVVGRAAQRRDLRLDRFGVVRSSEGSFGSGAHRRTKLAKGSSRHRSAAYHRGVDTRWEDRARGLGWTFAELDTRSVALVAEAERTLDTDIVMVYRPTLWGLVDPDTVAEEHLRPVELEPSQLECLQGLEALVGGVAVAYRRED